MTRQGGDYAVHITLTYCITGRGDGNNSASVL